MNIVNVRADRLRRFDFNRVPIGERKLQPISRCYGHELFWKNESNDTSLFVIRKRFVPLERGWWPYVRYFSNEGEGDFDYFFFFCISFLSFSLSPPTFISSSPSFFSLFLFVVEQKKICNNVERSIENKSDEIGLRGVVGRSKRNRN